MKITDELIAEVVTEVAGPEVVQLVKKLKNKIFGLRSCEVCFVGKRSRKRDSEKDFRITFFDLSSID